MRFAPRQLIQIGTAWHCRPNPAGGHWTRQRLGKQGNVIPGAKHVRQVFCEFAFGFLQNLTNNPEWQQ